MEIIIKLSGLLEKSLFYWKTNKKYFHFTIFLSAISNISHEKTRPLNDICDVKMIVSGYPPYKIWLNPEENVKP